MTAQPRQFDQRSFLPLRENRLAVAAVKKLSPNAKRRPVRLVTLVGPSGVGKSHLSRELVRSWDNTRVEGKILHFTASQFAAQLAEASAQKSIPQFQTRFRKDVKLLVCEDLDALEGRTQTQQQLVAAIDEIIANEGVVLLTSNRMPGQIGGLSRRLVNRIHGGICVNIDLPGETSRRQLIEEFQQSEGLRLSKRQIDRIAHECPVSPRELLGLITQLSHLGEHSTSIDAALRQLLEERTVVRQITIAEIASAAAECFGVCVADLKGSQRSKTVVLARQVAMTLARDLLGLSYVEIGEYFNRANHSTVIHSCQKMAKLRQEESSLDNEIRSLSESLQRGASPRIATRP